MADDIPVIIQSEPKKKRKGYCAPAGILKVLEILLCVVTLVLTELGRWRQDVTVVGYSDDKKTKETGVHELWGWLPFGYYHAHLFALCIHGTLAGTSLLLLALFLLNSHRCCGRRGFRCWLTTDFVYSVTGSCLAFIGFCLLAVFCAYPEIWRDHLFGGLQWRDIHNMLIVAAAVFGFLALLVFVASSVVSGRALTREMRNPIPQRKRRRIIHVLTTDK